MRTVFRSGIRAMGVMLALAVTCVVPVEAYAQASSGSYANQGEAFSACYAYKATVTLNGANSGGRTECVKEGAAHYRVHELTAGGALWTPHGGAFSYPAAATCAAMPPKSGGFYRVGSSPNYCGGGCAYAPTAGAATSTTSFGGYSYLQMPSMSPTGGVCDGDTDGTGTPVTSEECHTQGTLTQCIMPNGKHCAVASTGKKFCWQPTEHGTKQDGNEAATKSPSGAPVNPPPIPPPNNGNWQETGSGTVTVNNNGNTTTSNVTNFTSSNGATGDGGGSTNPDGSENPGEGDGEEDGNGTVSGGANCASPPAFSGGDPIANYAAGMSWRIQCQGEASGAAQAEVEGITTGLQDCVLNGNCGDVNDEGLPISEVEPTDVDDNPLANFQEEITEDDISFDESGFLGGGGQCPVATSVSVGDTNLSIGFGPLCDVLINISGIIMALGYFVAFKIVMGGL